MKEADILNHIIYTHNQHPERTGIPSDLVTEIKSAYRCTNEEALKYATTHCNSLTFYAVLFACGLISISYEEFIGWGLKFGAINKYGFIDWEKEDIIKHLCNGVKIITYYEPFDTSVDKIYQMKLINPYGTHFMGCYTLSSTMFISDPNDRGVGVTVESLKKDDKIEWIKEFSR